MINATRYVVLAIAILAIDAAAIESEAPEAAKAEHAAWEAAWSVALNEQRRRERIDAWVIYNRARAIYEADREGQVAAAWVNYQFARKIYEDAGMKLNTARSEESAARSAAGKAAQAVYETGRKKDIIAWENYQAALEKYEGAVMKHESAHKAERAARRAVRDAHGEAIRAARNAVEKANPARR